MGWKIGFNTPAIQQHFGLADPVVGYLLDRGVTPDGATVELAGWSSPAVEVEVAVRIGEPSVSFVSWLTKPATLSHRTNTTKRYIGVSKPIRF